MPRTSTSALARLSLATCALGTLVGCFTGPAQMPRYGRPDPQSRWQFADEASRTKPVSVAKAGQQGSAAGDAARSGGTLVPGKNGVEFRPGATPDEIAAEEDLTWGARFSRSWKRSWQTLTRTTPSQEKARQYYDDGLRLFADKRYDAAQKRFKWAGKLWPDSELHEDAGFLRGESLFFADRYSNAHDVWGEVLKKYENSRYLDKIVAREFAIGRYWEESYKAHPTWVLTPNLFDETRPLFDTAGNAVKAYETVRLNDPTGPLADDSVMTTANFYFLDQRYDDADYYYGLIRSDYPKSEFQLQAHLLGLRSKLRRYQGPGYDPSPLTEARDLVQHTLAQFPELDRDERQRLDRAGKTIDMQLALRDWEQAEYYAYNKHYRAAKSYYASLLRDYPDTRFASLARERMQSYQDLPDSPPERFLWLAHMFPGERKKTIERQENQQGVIPVNNVSPVSDPTHVARRAAPGAAATR